MAFNIMSAHPNDAEGLAVLYAQLKNAPCDARHTKWALQQIEKEPRYHLLIARSDSGLIMGTAMGIVCFDPAGSFFMVVENVVVDKAARGQGVGRELMDQLEMIARRENCGYMFLVSGDARKEAHQFYISIGYPPSRVRGFKKDLMINHVVEDNHESAD